MGNHIIDWVRSPNFISRYATCVCYQCKRHVTCETVNKSFWQNRAENWGVGSLFFCLLKGQRHLKTKTDTAGDGICRHLFFYTNFRDGCREIQAAMGREEEGFITADFDLDQLMEDRLSWGLFRDRRPEMYGKICSAI